MDEAQDEGQYEESSFISLGGMLRHFTLVLSEPIKTIYTKGLEIDIFFMGWAKSICFQNHCKQSLKFKSLVSLNQNPVCIIFKVSIFSIIANVFTVKSSDAVVFLVGGQFCLCCLEFELPANDDLFV